MSFLLFVTNRTDKAVVIVINVQCRILLNHNLVILPSKVIPPNKVILPKDILLKDTLLSKDILLSPVILLNLNLVLHPYLLALLRSS